MGPLTALRLVARDGVGVFYLQRIEINVAPKRFQAVALAGQVGIVGHDGLEECALFVFGQRGCIACERVEHDGLRELMVVVVGKPQANVGKPEAVAFAQVAHAHHLGSVAIGDERKLACGFGYLVEIFVLHNHQSVARAKHVVMVEHGGA